MADDDTNGSSETLSIQIANQIINIANTRREDGLPADEIASGLRHAAANFSAFAYYQSENKDHDPNAIVDEFVNVFSHYLDLHKPKEPQANSNLGLHNLVEQVKNEI